MQGNLKVTIPLVQIQDMVFSNEEKAIIKNGFEEPPRLTAYRIVNKHPTMDHTFSS